MLAPDPVHVKNGTRLPTGGRGLVALLLAALAAAPSPALGQSASALEQAKKWFREAEELEKNGDCVGAIDRFEKALAVKATPQLHLRVGACQEKVGRLVEAIGSYELALEKASAQSLPQVAAVAREQIGAIRPRIPSITVAPAKPYDEFRAAIDGVVLEAGGIGKKQPVNPGTHRVTAEAKGMAPFEQSFTLGEGDAKKLDIELASVAPDAPSAPGAPPPPPPPEPSKLPPIVLLGGGAAAIAAGVIVFVVSSGKDASIDDRCGGPERLLCPASEKDDIESEVSSVNTLRALSIGLGGAGLVAAGIGAALLVTSSPPPGGGEAAAASARFLEIGPSFGARGLGLAARGRF